MNRTVIFLLFCTTLIFVLNGKVGILHGRGGAAGDEFYRELQKTDPVRRDTFLAGHSNAIITGRGYVESVELFSRYHRKYRITMVAADIENLNIVFYVFTDNSDYLKILKKKDLFEFKGQLVIYTPLNTRRDSYILDIILEDGAVVVK